MMREAFVLRDMYYQRLLENEKIVLGFNSLIVSSDPSELFKIKEDYNHTRSLLFPWLNRDPSLSEGSAILSDNALDVLKDFGLLK